MSTPSKAALQSVFEQGLALHRAGRLQEARDPLKRVLQRDPRHFDALNLLGIICAQSRQPELAASLFRRAIQANDKVADVHCCLGAVLLDQAEPLKAIAPLERAIALNPAMPSAHYNRGLAFSELKDYRAALASLDAALALNPRYALAHTNRAAVLHALDRHAEALAASDAAIALNPGIAKAHYNRALILQALKRFDEAVLSNERAIALQPDYAEAHLNRSLNLLTAGHLREGFAAYRWRWARPDVPHPMAILPAPIWEGEDLRGKTIVAYHEQGFGDSLHFVRYAAALAKMAERVIVVTHPALVRLFSSMDDIEVRATHEGVVCDYHIPLMCLPRLFGTTLETVPASVPYLSADAQTRATWADRLADGRGGLKVGLVWAGDARKHDPNAHEVDRRRSLTLSQLAPLAAVPGVRFFSLQKGEPASQAADPPQGMDLVDHTADLSDFNDTAGLIAALDLVITVDTSVAHLAGALAKPVWVMSRFDGCWRWLNGREDSPWYPTMRLFHQRSPGDWSDVAARVAQALAGMSPSAARAA